MSEGGWITIVNSIMLGIGTMFASWMVLQQRKLGEKVDFVATSSTDNGKKIETVATKTENVEEQVAQTKAQVVENMRRLDGRLTLLVEETEKRAFQEGRAAALGESQEIAKAVLESDKAAREKALAEAQMTNVPASAFTTGGQPLTLPATVVIADVKTKK